MAGFIDNVIIIDLCSWWYWNPPA